jgi:hypothetical protein
VEGVVVEAVAVAHQVVAEAAVDRVEAVVAEEVAMLAATGMPARPSLEAGCSFPCRLRLEATRSHRSIS